MTSTQSAAGPKSPQKTAPIRAGVIGVGYFGRFHASKYATLPDAELIGVYDANPARAAEIAEEFGTTPYDDPDRLIADVEALSVAVPATAHHEVARKCLAAGRHSLVEKPIALTLDEADELIALARDNNCILQVGHQERFVFRRFRLHEIVAQPLEVECRRAGPFTGRNMDINVVLDLMIHDLDLSQQIMPYEVARLTASGKAVHGAFEDEVDVAIDTTDGHKVRLYASRIGDKLERYIRVRGPNRTFEIDFQNRAYRHYLTAEPDKEVEHEEGVPSPDELVGQDPLKEEVSEFLAAIRSGATPMVTGEAARKALSVALQINEALAKAQAAD